ncbi:LOW QUALITY PROTEIN: homeobox protein PKNOX1-like [Scylla paramamosain]|uniref:LOW QUALITY PROTEIN: homeobox protein PKNOX1-like n=1 Tax=Scylla paramamosain TaxID=85552 RepID=UPI003083DB4F
MMTAGYPEQGGGGGGPPSAGAAAVGGATAPTPQPVVPPAHAPAQPAHEQCLSGQPLQPDHHNYHDQAQFEADKRSVYKHPLFPLLALLFEKCELATQSADSVSSDSFNLDIQAFVQHQERDRKPFLMNDPEVDGLMIKAIQVLRIHLLELEKVQELCKDFCNRYITCLKGKMQSENLLRTEYGYDSPGSPDGGSPYNGHHMHHMHHPHPQVVSAHKTAPLTPPSCEEEEEGGMRARQRGVLPKHATAIMKAWLFQHIVHPYPSEDEKRHIAAQTNLTLLQVNNWFINARRRILQPMIDASTPPEQKTKKSKAYNPKASATRFWPDSLISLHGKPQNNNINTASSLAAKTNLNSEVAASPTSMTGEEDAEDIEDEDEEKTREQEEEVEEKFKDENSFFRPKSESPVRQELDS